VIVADQAPFRWGPLAEWCRLKSTRRGHRAPQSTLTVLNTLKSRTSSSHVPRYSNELDSWTPELEQPSPRGAWGGSNPPPSATQ
jgi:hypothetical protein